MELGRSRPVADLFDQPVKIFETVEFAYRQFQELKLTPGDQARSLLHRAARESG